MLITGESTWRTPREMVCLAMAVATAPTRAVSQLAARPIAWGKEVAPGWTNPCNASSNKMMGMPRRVSVTKCRCKAFDRAIVSGLVPARTWRPNTPDVSCVGGCVVSSGNANSCQNFSSRVIRRSRSPARAATGSVGSRYTGGVGRHPSMAASPMAAMMTCHARQHLSR